MLNFMVDNLNSSVILNHMVEHNKDDYLDRVFHSLADGTRRSILLQLKKGPMRVTDLAEKYDCSLNAVSKHIKVLERADLIKRDVQGRTHLCSVNPQQLKNAQQWIETYRSFWTKKLGQLEKFVTKTKKEKK